MRQARFILILTRPAFRVSPSFMEEQTLEQDRHLAILHRTTRHHTRTGSLPGGRTGEEKDIAAATLLAADGVRVYEGINPGCVSMKLEKGARQGQGRTQYTAGESFRPNLNFGCF
ncbi:hypothetical protein Trydic_g1556 [Trypoxylus dichotomus]